MSSGSKNFSLGKATSERYGAGGSGEPLTREVVQGTRWSMPTARRWGSSFLDSPARGPTLSAATAPATRIGSTASVRMKGSPDRVLRKFLTQTITVSRVWRKGSKKSAPIDGDLVLCREPGVV